LGLKKTTHKNLTEAKTSKKDEFYTQLSDIEKELLHYKEYFKGKVVFLNCDDPEESNFWKYFDLNFKFLGLKKLIATHFENEKSSYKLEKENGDTVKTRLKQNGDFRSPECIEILKEVDIVVTNPPFSLFREYITQLMEYNKKFIIIGSSNAFTYKEIFKLFRANKIWLGYSIHSGDREFRVPSDYPLTASSSRKENGIKYVRIKSVRWFTNLDYKQRHEDYTLIKKYNPEEYPKYDNYDAINVDVTQDIPSDYKGMMGVPITFLDKYNPEQFEIIGMASSAGYSEDVVGIPFIGEKDARPLINGKNTYARLIIRHKNL
jgi:hypothetical protein